MVEMPILILALEYRAEIGDVHIYSIASYLLYRDISVNAVHPVHLFQTIEQLHSYVGNYGIKGLTFLNFLFDVLVDGERKVLHDQEATAFKGRMMLVPRAFSQLSGKIS